MSAVITILLSDLLILIGLIFTTIIIVFVTSLGIIFLKERISVTFRIVLVVYTFAAYAIIGIGAILAVQIFFPFFLLPAFGLIAAIGICIIIGIAYYLFTTIRQPLQAISTTSTKIAEGNLSVAIIDYTRQDDIGVLVNSYRSMIDFLSPLVEKIQNASSRLSTSAEELASSAEEVSVSSQEISLIMQQTTEGTSRQAERLSQTIIMVEQLSQVVETSLTDIQEASTIIYSVADQTNILALNAAIEAARAGDYGRGFSVVADNVRRLAEETKTSSESIENILGKIRDQLQKNMETISIAVQDISSISEETSAGAQEVSAATEQQTSSMDQVTSSAQGLLLMANELQTMMDKFRV